MCVRKSCGTKPQKKNECGGKSTATSSGGLTTDTLVAALAAHATIIRPISELGHEATFNAYQRFVSDMVNGTSGKA